jgi:hypothetical protein
MARSRAVLAGRHARANALATARDIAWHPGSAPCPSEMPALTESAARAEPGAEVVLERAGPMVARAGPMVAQAGPVAAQAGPVAVGVDRAAETVGAGPTIGTDPCRLRTPLAQATPEAPHPWTLRKEREARGHPQVSAAAVLGGALRIPAMERQVV